MDKDHKLWSRALSAEKAIEALNLKTSTCRNGNCRFSGSKGDNNNTTKTEKASPTRERSQVRPTPRPMPPMPLVSPFGRALRSWAFS